MGWRHGHPNERHVQFAYRGRRCNYKHCQPVGRPPRYLRARARRERLSGLPDLGADQCGVPGCDWRSNSNSKCNSHSNANSYCYCHGHSYSYAYANGYCNRYSYTHGQTVANGTAWTIDQAASNPGAAAVAWQLSLLRRCLFLRGEGYAREKCLTNSAAKPSDSLASRSVAVVCTLQTGVEL